jgi:hypothetical protein
MPEQPTPIAPETQSLLDELKLIKEEGQKALYQFITAATVHNTVTTEVWCTLQVEATHNWPGCPFEEVDYLRAPHRHLFGIKAYVAVNHDDRDVEFIIVSDQHILQRRQMLVGIWCEELRNAGQRTD